MSSYGAFANIYDFLMRDIEYNKWALYIEKIWKHYNKDVKLVLDLCCGTGNMSVIMAERGYEVIGVDASGDMLSAAYKKAVQKNLNILFLRQKMQQLDLYGTVDSIFCVFDSINYILSKDELLTVFKRAHNFLNNGGLFIFDINTAYKYNYILGNNTFAEQQERCSYIWENTFDKRKKINEYAITFFIKTKNGVYKKATEYHYQRSYKIKEVITLLNIAGFVRVKAYNAYTLQKPSATSERVFFAAERADKKTR